MTVTARVFPAFLPLPRSLVLIVLTARASVSPLCARALLSFQRAIPPLAPSRFQPQQQQRMLNTISEARAPSTRRLYALKWSVFSTWCLNRGENPSTSELAVVLSFLQELLDKGRSHSTLKVFEAAIAAFHSPIAGQSVGRDNSVVRFLKGARRLNPPRPLTVPTWDLPTVLRALKGPPFEPLQSMDLRSLSLKTALLLALASVKRVEDLQALSTSPACLEFGPNDSKVVLKPRHGYVPKVLSTPFRAQVITLSALPPSEEDRELSLLCPVRALRIYFERSAPFRHTEQLFVSFGNRTKGHPVTKQRFSKWIVDAVMLAYSSLGLQCPIGVRAHSTRCIASSWAWSSGVSITEICTAAGWATPSTFARFYNLGHTGLTGQSPLCLDDFVHIRCGNNPVRDFLTPMRSGSLIGTLHTPVN